MLDEATRNSKRRMQTPRSAAIRWRLDHRDKTIDGELVAERAELSGCARQNYVRGEVDEEMSAK